MDAIILKGNWQRQGGSFDLVDEIKAIARDIVPEWPRHWITRTNWQGGNSRFITPYPHPVAYYNPGKREVFVLGDQIEGHEGVFELTYAEGVPNELRGTEPEKSEPAGDTSTAQE